MSSIIKKEITKKKRKKGYSFLYLIFESALYF